MAWADRAIMGGAFCSCFSGYLFARGPAVNDAQWVFRASLLGVGLLLMAVGLALKYGSSRPQ